MAYLNLMYRERADYECDNAAARAADLKSAGEWVDKTMATKKAMVGGYLRLEKQHAPQFQNRQHFVAICALLMRQILTGYERTRHAAKRGGGRMTVTLDGAGLAAKGRAVDLIALDDALNGWLNSTLSRARSSNSVSSVGFRLKRQPSCWSSRPPRSSGIGPRRASGCIGK